MFVSVNNDYHYLLSYRNDENESDGDDNDSDEESDSGMEVDDTDNDSEEDGDDSDEEVPLYSSNICFNSVMKYVISCCSNYPENVWLQILLLFFQFLSFEI